MGLEDATHVELAYALPHVHEGGLSIELQDAVTNKTLVYASVDNGGIVEGSGDDAGNERGFVVGFREIVWTPDDAPVFAYGHPMRIIAYYNATSYITGAMARVLLAGHPIRRRHK